MVIFLLPHLNAKGFIWPIIFFFTWETDVIWCPSLKNIYSLGNKTVNIFLDQESFTTPCHSAHEGSLQVWPIFIVLEIHISVYIPHPHPPHTGLRELEDLPALRPWEGRASLEAPLKTECICRTCGWTLVSCFLCTDCGCSVILGSVQEFLKPSNSFSAGETCVLGQPCYLDIT